MRGLIDSLSTCRYYEFLFNLSQFMWEKGQIKKFDVLNQFHVCTEMSLCTEIMANRRVCKMRQEHTNIYYAAFMSVPSMYFCDMYPDAWAFSINYKSADRSTFAM